MRAHWWFGGPSRARDARGLIADPNVAGAHVATFRRLVRVGPFVVYLMRYRPGNVKPVTCTGLTASWCPICGTCRCDITEDMADPRCPLHGRAATHAGGA